MKVKDFYTKERSNKSLAIFRREFDKTCVYCEKQLNANDYTIEHVLPQSLGGTWRKENVTIACHKCNQEKADMLLTDYIKEFRITITRRLCKYL